MSDRDDVQVNLVLERLATEPLRLRADNLVERPWGGRRLVAFKGLDGAAPPGRIGESFEVAADPHDPEASAHPSVVEFADGSTIRLPTLLARAGEVVLGKPFFAAFGARFPLLPKFLDVEQLLSVQSHPAGNPEVYVVIEAEPGATLGLGFARDVDPVATIAALEAGRADQDALLELLNVTEPELASVSERFGAWDAVAQLVEQLGPRLHDPSQLPRLRELLTRLDACYRETLALLNRIELRPGMVLFNAHPPGAVTTTTPSSVAHCLGNREGKSALLLEIRRPGVTWRAWDHARFPRRELAIEQAFASMSTSASRPESFSVELRPLPGRPGVFRSVRCPAFVVDHLRPAPGLAVAAACDGLPSTLHGIAGVARLHGPGERDFGQLRAGQSMLLPAGLDSLRVTALTDGVELVQVTVPLPEDGARARRSNLAQMRRVVADSSGPREVLAIVNAGDGERIGSHLRAQSPAIFRADGATTIACHEEWTRRGQLLGLLDAVRGQRPLDPNRTAVGIMLPGKGTRLSPLTQQLGGIKPMFPVPIRAEHDGAPVWLDAAGASLWTWTLVAATLERQGFRGIAWKWGDEPQIAARELARYAADLSNVDAVRFGSSAVITDDLACNKEWLLVDPRTGDLITQLRRRPRSELLTRMGLADSPGASAHVHIGSPAFSHLFLRHAEALFGDLDGWLDVDGHLFEALTQSPEVWATEIERDADLRATLERCPDFYARARELRRRIEDERGHPLRIAVVDFGADPYWADIGQLDKARAVWSGLRATDEHGAFARELAGIVGEPDRFGNYVIGDSRIPIDGSVRDSVMIDAVIERGQVTGAVVVRSKLGLAGLEPGAVVIDATVDALRMGADSLAFGSVSRYLRVPDQHVHTSIPVDFDADPIVVESWFADARENPGAPENYDPPRYGNPDSFAAKAAQLRRRSV